MVHAPYTGGNNALESPCIAVSAGGDTWTEPEGLTNPIETLPATYVYSDPSIFVDGESVMWCIFRESNDNHTRDFDKLYVKSSSDGVTWSAKQEVLSAGFGDLLSPTVIWDADQWVLYVIKNTTTRTLMRYEASAPTGPWAGPVACTLDLPTGVNPWHIDVVKDGSEYHAFINERVTDAGDALYFAASLNGTDWTMYDAPLLSPSASGWDDDRIYRACGIRTATGYDLWYSAVGSDGGWRVGRTTMTMEPA